MPGGARNRHAGVAPNHVPYSGAPATSPALVNTLAALTDRAASRLAPTLSKYVSPSVGTKCGPHPYSICRTAPDGVVMLWHGQIQRRGEKPVLRRPGD